MLGAGEQLALILEDDASLTPGLRSIHLVDILSLLAAVQVLAAGSLIVCHLTLRLLALQTLTTPSIRSCWHCPRTGMCCFSMGALCRQVTFRLLLKSADVSCNGTTAESIAYAFVMTAAISAQSSAQW